MECIKTTKSSNSRLQFYSIPPTDIVKLGDVENLAIERLKVLRCIETVSQDYIKGSKDYDDKIYAQLSKCSDLGKSFLDYSGTASAKSMALDIKNDNLSHFILVLAYCRTDDLSHWFIQHEMDLFKYRFGIEKIHNAKAIHKLLRDNNVNAKQASVEEVARLKKWAANPICFKVKATLVLDLLKLRKVFVDKGWAYLWDEDIYSLAATHFRANLSHSLSFMRLLLPRIAEDTRLLPILASLNKRYLGRDYAAAPCNDKITAAMVPALAKASFPPCMQKTQSALARDHHLRHAGRLQYGLFLKGIGLSLDESLRFWRDGFRGRVDADKFGKEYSYAIRHNYGQVGSRTAYKPQSCARIITGAAPGPGDCHGCPFQHSSLDLMVQTLRSSTSATAEQLDAIVTKAKAHQYQISCAKYFKLVHGLPDDHAVTINHPNEFFDESQKMLAARLS